MSEFVINSQEFELKYARVVTALGQPIDLKALIIELNYFEDIFTNCVTGNIVVNDSNDLLSTLSFSGNEYLVFNFDKPTLNSPIERVFRIYSVTKRILTRDTNENYVLNFCSEEMVLSEQYRVSKSYKNKKVSEIVTDICNNYLKINPKRLNTQSVESTKNTLNLIVPNLKPFEAINWLTTYAQSSVSQTKASTYLFYENRNGYNFKSLQALYDSPIYTTYSYEPKNIVSSNDYRVRDLEKDIRNAISYEIIDQFNTISSVSNGGFANKLLTVDLLNQSHDQSVFDYSQYFTQSKKMNDNGLLTNAQNRFGDMLNETPDGPLRLCTSIKSQSQNSYVKSKNFVIKDIEVENYIPYRMAQLAHIMTIKLKLVVPGDVLLTVGSTINFNLPTVGIDRKLGKELDDYYSGKYLITAVRHKADQTGTFQTILEISKESLPTPYGSFDNNLPALKELRAD